MINEKQTMRRWRKNCCLFAEERLKVKPEREQIELFNAVSTHDRVSLRSGHGIGKSHGLACISLWWLFTRYRSTTICTAPTFAQLTDILWSEFDKILDNSGLTNYVNSLHSKIGIKGMEKQWRVIARSCKVPENLAGRHAKYLMYVIDEASGINPKIDEVIEGALTNKGNKLIMAGNPTQISGIFHSSHTKHRDLYKCLHFNSEKSAMVSEQYIKNIEKKYGKDSDIYRVRVLGEFPRGGADTLIPLWIVEAAVLHDVSKYDGDEWEIGVDPARYGSDESVIATRHMNEIFPLEAFNGINTVRLAGMVAKRVKEIRKTKYKKKIRVKVDDTGVGAGVTDNLEEIEDELNIEVVPVNNGAKAKEVDEYYNLGAETWGQMKNALSYMKIPNDENLIGQISTRKYKVDVKGRIQLEKKEDMKKRGLTSPDRGDAVALCLTDYTPDIADVIDEEFFMTNGDYINEPAGAV